MIGISLLRWKRFFFKISNQNDWNFITQMKEILL